MRRWVLIVTLLLATGAVAQTSHWEVGLNGGWSTPHDPSLSQYATWSNGMDVAWAVHMTGYSYWQLYRRYPTFAVRGSFGWMPVNIAGHRFGVVGVIRAPLWGRLDYNIAAGLSAYTKPRWLTHDSENIFISTLVCCLFDFGFVYNITDWLMLSASFLHSSNGFLVNPNKGLDFLQAGLTVKLGDVASYKTEDPRKQIVATPFFDCHEVGFMASVGFSRSRHSVQKGLYFDYDLSLNYRYYLNPVISTGATVDLWYNGSHLQQMDWYHDTYPIPMYVSAMWTMEGHWGPVSIAGGIGAAILTSTRVDMPIYERLGAYYNWGNNVAGVAIHAQYMKAEFIEWSYGRRFPIRRNR